jgi:glycolate oxidase FAD binding subunit
VEKDLRDPPTRPPELGRTAGLDVRTPTVDDAVNGVLPQRVVRVRSLEEVVEVVGLAAEYREPLVVRGGGTLLSIGNAPRELATVLAMDGMDRLLSYSPEDMVVTIQAGMSLSALDEELAQAGQCIAIEAPDPGTATIGGLSAANFNTGVAYGFGYPRDQILGLTVVDGNARVLRVGGRVVKNVAGYDMPRLFIGAFGTLAVITEVTIRTQPRPEAREDISFEFTDEASLEMGRQRIFRAPVPLLRFDIDAEAGSRGVRWRIRVSTEGSAKQVEHMRRSIPGLFHGLSHTVEAPPACDPCNSAFNFVARFATQPSGAIADASSLLRTVRTVVESPRAVIECGGALIRLYAECRSGAEAAAVMAACRERCVRHARALVFERLPAEQQGKIDVWNGPIHGLALMRRLKEKFDPCRVLAPGRFVGGI